MKKSALITLLSASLLLGVAAVTLTSKNQIVAVEASSMNHTSGSFIRVTDISMLAVGDKVIFVSDDGYAMDDIWGNPGYLHGTQGGVSMPGDLSTVTLTDSKATLFTVEEGTETATFDKDTDHPYQLHSYSFRADVMSITGQRKKNVYLSYNEKYYYDDNTFEYIGYFKDRGAAVEVKKKRESSWFIQFSPDPWNENRTLTHIRNGKSIYEEDYETELGFTHRYADMFSSDGTRDINIYKIPDENAYSISIVSYPKTSYILGETIDLTGLVIDVHQQGQDDSRVTYSDLNKELFTFPEGTTAYGNGDVPFEIEYDDMKFILPITVSKPEPELAKKATEVPDYSGKYMMVESGNDYGFDAQRAEDSSVPGCKNQNIIIDNVNKTVKGKTSNTDFEFTVSKVNQGYQFKSNSGKYLNLDNLTMSNSPATIGIDYVGGEVRIKNSSGNYLYFNGDWNADPGALEFGVASAATIDGNDYYKYVVLYRFDLTNEEQADLDEYISEFLGTTDVCDENGASFNITSEDWAELASDFNSLSATLKAVMVNTTYDIAYDEYDAYVFDNNIQFAMSRYDYIYSKYHNSINHITDFIGRNTAGTMKDLSLSTSSIKLPLNELSSDATITIAVVVTISLLMVISFALYKKMKSE